MKSFFRLFIFMALMSPNVYSREIILITHYNNNKNQASLVKKVIIDNYNLPDKFIKIIEIKGNCQSTDNETLMHICIKNKKIFFSQIKIKKMNNLIAMFSNLNLNLTPLNQEGN